ncbi:MULTISPECIES: fused MFS/spermidine synthase [Nitrosomonas]|uniref:SAM-dependent methlyltransferase n=1 Tax=Nitrosomonas communis TaxID=44574 RepID=A0A0F7KE63_9PROT|nr:MULTISPECIES: fused MFS/spermidine synthase [Nitrosomonas]AKH37104.1 SAM-dependent methlyltransferase [Nitrosomonas communis]TYP94578.1 spermidine synthase [Nitrosomonas communis]UVS62271.1 fused MFS/spermidine synthase [Nitrosomonas sp. PLL12]
MTQPLFPLFTHLWLYCTVFLTGAAVMVIELLGTRLIAPFYGASLYVWASLISVTMIALAIGYFVGGRWADRAKRMGLTLIIALAGMFTLIVPWITGPILLATDSLGLRLGTFISTLILFTPSLTMLGMVGPFAVKLATSNLDGIGASTGSIYAVSTVGSVVGTLFLGFYLFPRIGSHEIFLGLGSGLFLLALIVAFFERKRFKLTTAILPVMLLFFIGVSLLPKITNNDHKQHHSSFQTRFERESLYGWVRVIDNPTLNLRLLTADASTIGAAGLSHGENVLTYQKIVGLIPMLAPDMSKALLIGQGAGHMATNLQHHGILTDTIEIDPAVAEAAQNYFDFTPTGKTIIGDARYEIRQLQGTYDLIILDVFTGGSEPVHLLTKETLSQIHALLSEQGLLALNFVSFLEEGTNIAVASVAKTLAEVFPYQLVFISEPGIDFNDFIFIVSKQLISIDSGTLKPDQSTWLRNRLLNLDQHAGIVLTDNFNPLEYFQANKSEYYRRMLVDSFGTEFFIR